MELKSVALQFKRFVIELKGFVMLENRLKSAYKEAGADFKIHLTAYFPY